MPRVAASRVRASSRRISPVRVGSAAAGSAGRHHLPEWVEPVGDHHLGGDLPAWVGGVSSRHPPGPGAEKYALGRHPGLADLLRCLRDWIAGSAVARCALHRVLSDAGVPSVARCPRGPELATPRSSSCGWRRSGESWSSVTGRCVALDALIAKVDGGDHRPGSPIM